VATHGGGGDGGASGGSGWPQNAGEAGQKNGTVGALAGREERFECDLEGHAGFINMIYEMGVVIDLESFHWRNSSNFVMFWLPKNVLKLH